jgi:hypothetical protein
LRLLLILLLATLSLNIFAQQQEQKFSELPLKERLFLGGNIGLQFGNRQTFVEVSPLVGLWLSPKIVAGVGPVYRYFKYSDLNFTYEDNQFGGRIFGRYYFLDNFFAHAEYELLNLADTRDFTDFPDFPRTNLSSTLVGGGYTQMVGRSGVFILVLFNLTETVLTPYSNPVLRVGFNIGL